eukprot:scaffold7375_cov268-Pinguiococcus_pyrenoidosus.AAC.50
MPFLAPISREKSSKIAHFRPKSRAAMASEPSESSASFEDSEAATLLEALDPNKTSSAKERRWRVPVEWCVACSIAVASLILGLSTPTNDDLPAGYATLSNVIGYVFLLAWSCSFYPQIIQNFTRKTTIGLNADYLYLNGVGYFLYSLYNLLYYFDESLRRRYRDENDGNNILVELHDVLFAVHAFVLTTVQILQCLHYDGLKQTPNWPFQLVCAALLLTPAVWFAVQPSLTLIQVAFLSYEKLAVTVVKYMPQLIFNHRRRSTEGWSIGNILLDITGGVFSMLQLFLDAFAVGNPAGIKDQVTKLGLGFVSIFYGTYVCAPTAPRLHLVKKWRVGSGKRGAGRPQDSGTGLSLGTDVASPTIL